MPPYRGKITAPRSSDAEMIDVSSEYETEPIPQDEGLVDVSQEYRGESGTWDALKKGVAKGMLGLSEMGGTAAQYIGGRIGSETLQKVGQESREHVQAFSERYDPSEKIQGDIVEKPELLKSPEWWAYNIGQTGTSILPGIAVGVLSNGLIGPHLKIAGEAFQWSPKLVNALARIGTALPAGVVGGAQEGASTYEEMMKKGADEATAARGAELMTLASAALNAISFDQMLKTGTGVKGKALLNFLKRGTLAGGTEALTEYAEEPAEVGIKRMLTPDQFSEEEAKKQLISGVNVVPPSFVIGLLTGGIAGNIRKEGSKPYSDAVQQVTQDGTLEQTTDEELQILKDNTEVLKKKRSFDKPLQEAAAKVDAEVEKRSTALPQDFFDQMGSFLEAGQDKAGTPFGIEQVKSFRDQYAANPKVNPASLQQLDKFIEDSEISTIARPDDEPTVLMHSLRSDLMQGLSIEEGIQRGNEIKGRHPQLADDINKLIIEFQGRKIDQPVNREGIPSIGGTEGTLNVAPAAQIQPVATEQAAPLPTPQEAEIVAPAPAGEAVTPKTKAFDPDNDRQRQIFVAEILKSDAPEVKALMKQAEEAWPGEDPLPVVESQIDYDLQKAPKKWLSTEAGKGILARKGWGEKAKDEFAKIREQNKKAEAEPYRPMAEWLKLSNEKQKEVDARHDALEKKGVSWEDQQKDEGLTKLYDERIHFDTAAMYQMRRAFREDIKKNLGDLGIKDGNEHGLTPTPDSILDNILRFHPDLGAYSGEKFGETLDNPQTLKDLTKLIAREELAKTNPAADLDLTLESPMSGLTEEGKSNLIKKAGEKAKKIIEGLKEVIKKEEAPAAKREEKAPEKREDLSPHLRSLILMDMKTALEEGKHLGFQEFNHGEGWERTMDETSNPPFLNEIMKEMRRRNKKDANKEEILSVIKHDIAGTTRTLRPKQVLIWLIIDDHVKNMAFEPHYVRANEVMSGAADTLAADWTEGMEQGQYRYDDLEFPPTEKEVAKAASEVVGEEYAKGNTDRLQTYQAERGEAHQEANAPAAEKAKPAEEVKTKTEPTKAGTQAVIPGASEAETFMLTGAPGEVGAAAPKGKKQETATIEEVAGEEEKAEKKAEEPKPRKPKKEKTPKPTTEDVGEELTHNKRNRIKGGIKWADIEGKNTALKVKETTKQNVYPRPDYQALVDGGMEPMVAHFVKQVYDSISAKPNVPQAPTDANLQRYIDAINRVMEGTVRWASNDEAVAQWAKSQMGVARAAVGQTVNISALGKRDVGLLETVYPDGWKGYADEVRILGGNKLLRALQPGFDEGKRAMKAIKEGWPAQQEAWQKRGIKVLETAKAVTVSEGGRYEADEDKMTKRFYLRANDRMFGDESYATKEEAQGVIDKLKPWFVTSGRDVISQHDTQEAATEAARESVKREAKKDQVSEKGTSVEMAERTGPARRMEGEDVSSERLQQSFGFKGINFGNWMKGESNAKERQLHLNHAFDSFMDLSEILGVPPKALSLNGMLGLAIGAQGTGKHAAHFVPGVNEINLTRTAGAGAVSHEWGHGLDHYFASQAGLANSSEPFLTEHVGSIGPDGYRKVAGRKVPAFESIRPEIVAHFKAIVDAMRKRNITAEEQESRTRDQKEKARKQTENWIKAIRSDFERQGKVDMAAFDKLADRIMKLDLGEGKISAGGKTYLDPAVAEMRELFKTAAGRVYDIGNIQALQANVDHFAYLNSERFQQREHVPQQTNTKYLNEALGLDKGKGGKKYWSTSLEMFARAFDAYVTDTLKENAAKNTYLSGIESAPPRGEERKALNDAFKNLISEIQTRETPQGVEMYNVREIDAVRSGASFSEQLDDFAAGKLINRREPITVGQTPNVLRMLGAEPLPIVITQGTVEKATTGKHGISIDTMKMLPSAIENPIMVFDSATEADSLVVMTELRQDGKSIVAAIRLSKDIDKNVVNDIISVHPRNSEYHFINWINQGLLRYQDKQKSRAWSLTSGLQLPGVSGAVRGFKNKILFSHDLVKWRNENVGTEQLSVRDDHRRGALRPAKLEDVKKAFPGQEVGLDANRNIYVKTRGGKYVTIYKVSQIEADPNVLMVGYGTSKVKPGSVIPGAMGVTAEGEHYIKLHRTFADNWTLFHESFHFIETAGIVNSLDVAALRGHIKRLHREGKFETVNRKDIGGPEDRANFIADRLAVKDQRGPIGRIILRIRAFIDGILESFGVRGPESILRQIESGRIFDRKGLSASEKNAMGYAMTSKPGAGDITTGKTLKPEGGIKTLDKDIDYYSQNPQKLIDLIDSLVGDEPVGIGLRAIHRDEVGKNKFKRSWEVPEDTFGKKRRLPGTSTYGLSGIWPDDPNHIIVERFRKHAGDVLGYGDSEYIAVVKGTPVIRETSGASGEIVLSNAKPIAYIKRGKDGRKLTAQAPPAETKLRVNSSSYDGHENIIYYLNDGSSIAIPLKEVEKLGTWASHDKAIEIRKSQLPNPPRPPESGGQYFEVLTPDLPDFMQQYLTKKQDEVNKEYPAFKFDEKSTENEGWWQLRPAKEFKKDSFRRVDSWYGIPLVDGIHYVIGTREGLREPQAIRFNKKKFTEDQATAWWERNKAQFATSNLFRPKAQEMPAFEPGKLNDWLNNETELNVQALSKREANLAAKGARRLMPSNLPHNTWLENILKSPEWMSHPVISRIVKLMMSTRSELFHENFHHMTDNKVIESTKDLKGKGLSWAEVHLQGKVSKEYELFGRMMDYGDTYYKRNRKDTLDKQKKDFEKWMRANGATDEIIKVWKLHRDTYDRGLDMMTAQMRTMLGDIEERAKETGEEPSELRKTLQYHLAQMDEWKGFYAPRVRTKGSWWVWAHKGPADNREYVMDFRGSGMAADRLAAKLKEQGWTVSRVEEAKRLPEDIYQQTKTIAVARAIEQAMADMKKGVKGQAHEDLIAKFHEELLENVSDEIKARGFRSSMIHRSTDKIVKGYKEDPLERLVIYTNNTSAGLAKSTTAKMAVNELFGEKDEETGEHIGGIDPVKEPRAYQTAQAYIEEQLRNMDQSDMWIGLAKSIATFKYLGFNLRSAFVNTTALATTAPPAIQQYALDGKVGFTKVMNALAAASKDYAKVMAGGKLESGEQAFLEEIKRKGYDDPQYTRDALGSIMKIQHRAWGLAMDASMYVFGKTEQWNRGTTMLAAYRMARKQGFDHEESTERAKTASDKAHGIYGKATLPMWAMGKNPAAKIGQMMYVYAKFSHNYLQMLYDLGLKKKNIKALAFATLAPLVVGGMAAFPFKDQIFGLFGLILKTLFGEDWDPEKFVWDEIRKNFGSTAEAVGRHGITGLMGLDISSSLSIGVGVPKGFSDLAGPAGGVWEDVSEAWRYGTHGQPWRMAEKLAPRALENPLKAYRESQEGAVTRHGYRVWDEKGKPFIPSEGEAAVRAFGFRGTRQAVISERTNEAKREIKAFGNRKSAIYERYRAYLAGKKDPAEHREITRKVREFNEGLRKAGVPKEEVPRITFESMRRQAERMRKPTKQQKAMLE